MANTNFRLPECGEDCEDCPSRWDCSYSTLVQEELDKAFDELKKEKST